MLTVRDVMSRPPLTVRPETSLKDVARLLVEHRISGLPVVDAGGRVVGVVSEADLLLKEGGAGQVRHRRLVWLLGESGATRAALAKTAARTAGDAMTRPPVTITSDRPVTEAATLMSRRQVNRLPVVEGDVLVGIVSRADLVRAFVRSDEQLADTIRDDVLYRTLWLNPVNFDVEVRDGVVRIRGAVERRSTAAIIERVGSMVPGVVDVVDEVRWEVDDREIEAPERDLVSPYGRR